MIFAGVSRRQAVLSALAAILALVAIQRLADGFHQLVWLPTPPVDLAIRWREVQQWFAGQPVHGGRFAVYPPASYALLWPLVGWIGLAQARWLWGATTVAAVSWLAWTTARESGTGRGAAKAVAALLPVAIYPTRAVMVNGQLALHLLPPLLGGLLLLTRYPPSWGRDLSGSALLLFALTKPTLTAPFMWIVLAAPGPVRPAALLVVGYAGLTLFAGFFQPASADVLFRQFAGGAVRDAARAAAQSHANLHGWIDALGLGWGYTAASLAALLALGWWTYCRARDADPWVKLGVAGLVARFWTFHYRYDDMLLLVPVVALLRFVTRPGPGEPIDRGALVMLTLLTGSLLIPARLFFPPWPWEAVESIQTVIWLAALGFLVHRARGARPSRT